MTSGTPYVNTRRGDPTNKTFQLRQQNTLRTKTINRGDRFPQSILRVNVDTRPAHPTQKPVALLEWLVLTYTNLGDTVLDPCMGSGVTGVACARLGRNFIGIEKDEGYFNVASKRIAEERRKLGLA